MKSSRRNIWIAALCLYIIAVAYLCFMNPDDMPEVRPDIWGIPIDKIMHFIMFFPYPVLAYAAFRPSGRRRIFHILILLTVLVTGAGLAMGTERLQGMLEYRSFDINDFYADMIGMTCSTALTMLFALIRRTDVSDE